MDTTRLISTAKLIAVPIPFILAGYSISFSQNAVPALYDHPAQVGTPAFKKIFYSGAALIVPGQLVSAAATGYLTYILPAERQIWAIALAASLMPLPWTSLVMGSGIKKLIEISEDKGKQEKATANLQHRQLLTTWVKQNYFRTACFLVAGIAAWRATVPL